MFCDKLQINCGRERIAFSSAAVLVPRCFENRRTTVFTREAMSSTAALVPRCFAEKQADDGIYT